MKTVMEEKLNEIEIPDNLHERCMAGVMKARIEMKEENKTKENKVEECKEKESKIKERR